VHGQRNPDAQAGRRQKAYEATLTAAATTLVGGFHGSVSTVILIQDIAALHTALRDVDSQIGKVATVFFGDYSGYLELKFTLDKTGHLTVSTTLIDDPDPTATLTFQLKADQSYLAAWIDNIERVLSTLEQETNEGK
jgi:hypothetical protein